MSKSNKKTILCTGSGGFVLSNFIRRSIYNKFEYNFVSIDNIKESRTIDNVYTNKNHSFYIGDITDKHFVNILFEIERPDIVIHGAAETNKNSNNIINPNVDGTNILLEASLKWNIERFVLLSSDGVYGAQEDAIKASWAEETPLNPKNTYAASKAAAELLVKASDIKYNIARLCNNYGPRQSSDKFIPSTIKHILNNEPVQIYDQGRQVRDWIHVFDTCSALISIVEGPINETYNISAGNEFSTLEVFQYICNSMNKGHGLATFIPAKNKDFRRALSGTKLRNLGWKPEYKLKDGIATCCEWYMNNQWFLNKKY